MVEVYQVQGLNWWKHAKKAHQGQNFILFNKATNQGKKARILAKAKVDLNIIKPTAQTFQIKVLKLPNLFQLQSRDQMWDEIVKRSEDKANKQDFNGFLKITVQESALKMSKSKIY